MDFASIPQNSLLLFQRSIAQVLMSPLAGLQPLKSKVQPILSSYSTPTDLPSLQHFLVTWFTPLETSFKAPNPCWNLLLHIWPWTPSHLPGCLSLPFFPWRSRIHPLHWSQTSGHCNFQLRNFFLLSPTVTPFLPFRVHHYIFPFARITNVVATTLSWPSLSRLPISLATTIPPTLFPLSLS